MRVEPHVVRIGLDGVQRRQVGQVTVVVTQPEAFGLENRRHRSTVAGPAVAPTDPSVVTLAPRTPARAEVVGSLLRPAVLRSAIAAFHEPEHSGSWTGNGSEIGPSFGGSRTRRSARRCAASGTSSSTS
jgi:hypothetical protein